MYRAFLFANLLFISAMGFAQQDSSIRITGRIPGTQDGGLYQIQVGAYRIAANAERVFQRLKSTSLDPIYESYLDFTRVIIAGIKAGDVPFYLEAVRNAGFSEVFIKIDTRIYPAAELPPVSNAALPSDVLREIGYRSVKVGETISLADIAVGRNVVFWRSSTPSAVSVDSNGTVTGLRIGNGYVSINEIEYISIAVVPSESFYQVPESEEALLPPESKTGRDSTVNISEYRTEPTFRLAYRFANKGENNGASGTNGGVDILGRGQDYEWLWTTYYQGGWFYDLNGVMREMIDGYQKDARNGVELTVKPEFVYDDGVPYLQMRNVLHNPADAAVAGQKFGATADIMIHRNDDAPLTHTDYGAYMTDSPDDPSLELMLICESGGGVNPVDTLWLGTYYSHLENIYTDRRSGISGVDSAIGFSYQNIDLAPGETKEFIVRFTLARTEQ